MTQPLKVATREQIVALLALYSRWRNHSLPERADPRAARLAWASGNLNRSISSFSNLSGEEARHLIDLLKDSMGQPLNERPDPWRRVNCRDRAQAAGTAGRRGEASSLIHMASPEDLARVEELICRLKWTRERFEGWLKSPRSPLRPSGQITIRTATQANRVYWALKAMLVRAGGWCGGGRRETFTEGAKVPKHSDVGAGRGQMALGDF
jgi:hypothetical protein